MPQPQHSVPSAPVPFELLSFRGSSDTAFSDWFIGLSTDSVTAFSYFSCFLNRGKPPNLVIGPPLFNIIHSIVSTSTSYSSLHPIPVMFSLSSVHVLSLLGHKIWLESSSSLSSLSLPLFNHLIYPIFIILNFHSQCHSSYLGLYDTFCLDYINNFFTEISPSLSLRNTYVFLIICPRCARSLGEKRN